MPTTPPIIDIHCHPSMKPYGQSFTPENETDNPQPSDKTSLWHTSIETKFDRILTDKVGAAMYTQSSLSSAAIGGLQVLCLSIGALEQEFITVTGKIPKAIIKLLGVATHSDAENVLCNVVTRAGKERLTMVRKSKAYFPDLMKEIDYIKSQEHTVFKLEDGKYYKFVISSNGAEVSAVLVHNSITGVGITEANPIIISIVLTVEGMHNLDVNHGVKEDIVLKRVVELKQKASPFYVTFCHHFWNGLCGHASSLPAVMSKIFDQKLNKGEGFNALGLKVLMALQDNTNGNRVLIDVKHLSYKARNQYYNLLDGRVPDDVKLTAKDKKAIADFFRFNSKQGNPPPPVIASHAAVNGYVDDSPKTKIYKGNYPSQAPSGVVNPFENKKIYADPSLNFYDTDILQIARYQGLIGIQLDERRIAGPSGLQATESIPDPKLRHAFLVWNQIVHIVELLDRMGFPNAWERICIGSDFDGIIAPMDRLHRLSDYTELREGLLHFCKLYFLPTDEFEKIHPGMARRGMFANANQDSGFNPSGKRMNPNGANVHAHTGMEPEDIISRICYKNAADFMFKWYV